MQQFEISQVEKRLSTKPQEVRRKIVSVSLEIGNISNSLFYAENSLIQTGMYRADKFPFSEKHSSKQIELA